jgi:hypothetical protein
VISGSALEGIGRDARWNRYRELQKQISRVVCETAPLILFEPQLEVTLSKVLPAPARPVGLLPFGLLRSLSRNTFTEEGKRRPGKQLNYWRPTS